MRDLRRAFPPILIALVMLRAVLSLTLWIHAGGFFWLTAEDASRMNLAFLWSEHPFFNLPGNPSWLPLPTWIHGIALSLAPDPLSTSAAVSTAFSLAAMPLAFWITKILFSARTETAALAATLVGFTPWIVWLGLSGLSEPIFHALLLTGMLFWSLAIERRHGRWALGAALAFLASSMARYEGWIFALLLAAFCLLEAKRGRRPTWHMLCAALSCSFIPVWLLWQWSTFSNPFYFAENSARLARPAGVLPFLTLMPSLSPYLVGLGFLGVGAALWRHRARAYLIIVALFYTGLVVALRGTLPGNLPIRIFASVLILLVPFAAFAVQTVTDRLREPRLWTSLVLALALGVGTAQSFGYHFQARASLIRVATEGRALVDAADPGGKILVEARRGGAERQSVIWDSMFLHSIDPRRVVYDRKPSWILTQGVWVLDEKDNPSLLNAPPKELTARLRRRNVVVVISYSAKARAAMDAIMHRVATSDEYSIHVWKDE